MPAFEVLSIVVIGILAWFWLDGLKVRELAIAEARTTCTADGLQFLDETVATSRIRLSRNDEGRLQLCRTYSFEYSETGDNRKPGSIVMLGNEVLMLNVGLRVLH